MWIIQKYTEVPVIENGDMESSTGWNFTSNTDNITGSYVNGSGIDSSYAYRIVNSYEGNLSEPFGIWRDFSKYRM